MNILRKAALGLLIVGVFSITVAPGSTATTVDVNDRKSSYEALQYYKSYVNTPSKWTGSVKACNPGTNSAAFFNATLQSLNYHRQLAGLQKVTMNTDASDKQSAQRAALMMEANNALSHFPPSSWKCYSPMNSASTSNLCLRCTGPWAVMAYIADEDSTNRGGLGHRRSLLNPEALTMTTGSTNSGDALMMDDFNQTIYPEFFGYPGEGYFPFEMNFSGVWSFSTSNYDISFDNATVEVRKNGVKLPIKIVKLNDYVTPAISWDLDVYSAQYGKPDQDYVVRIKGMKEDSVTLPDYEYTVKMFDGNTGPKNSVYRFYNTSKKRHFFTASASEYNSVIRGSAGYGWRYEGIEFIAKQSSGCESGEAVYRFYSSNYKTHFYTTSSTEKQDLIDNNPNWRYENIAYCASKDNDGGSLAPVYRFYSKNRRTHLYTTSETERSRLIADKEWRYEGTTYYANKDIYTYKDTY